jgi:heme/copper-type cytochrome/quinol oxidase subunit 3
MTTDVTIDDLGRVPRHPAATAGEARSVGPRIDAWPNVTRVGDGLDVRELPSYVFSHRSLMWWGTVGMMAIEATVFVLAVMAYFYLRTRIKPWPPGVPPPDLLWGTLNTVILLASAVPNHLAKKGAERLDLPAARMWTWVGLAFGVGFIIVRALEFTTLNCRWDTNAYGSAVWTLLGLHTLHLITDVLDTLVLAVLLVTGPFEGRRFSDISDNGLYWYFVVFTWLPLYAVIYLAPRL